MLASWFSGCFPPRNAAPERLSHVMGLRLQQWLHEAVQSRNKREVVPFRPIFESQERLYRELTRVTRRTILADEEVIVLRRQLADASGPGAGAAKSDVMKRMQDELNKLHSEVTHKYRGEAERASDHLRLMKERQQLEGELALAQDRLGKLQAEHGDTMAQVQGLETRCSEQESALQLQLDEMRSLRSLLDATESTKNTALKENTQLADRMVFDKMALGEEVNSLNEEVAALRGALALAQKAAREAGGGGGEAAKEIPSQWGAWMRSRTREARRSSASSEQEGRQQDQAEEESAAGRDWIDIPVHVPSRCCVSVKAHQAGVNDVCLNSSGSSGQGQDGLIATASNDSTVKIWHATSGRQCAMLQASSASAASVAMLAVVFCGDLVAAGCSDSSARVWNHRTGREMGHLTGHRQRVVAVSFGNGGRTVLTGSHDCSIKLFDLEKQWSASPALLRATSKVNSVDMAAMGDLAVSGHVDGGVRMWDLRTSKRARSLKHLYDCQVTCVRFSPPGGRGAAAGSQYSLLTIGQDGTLKVIDLRTYEVVANLGHANYRTPSHFSRASFSPGGTHVAAGSADGGVYIWEVRGGGGSSSSSSSSSSGGGRVGAILEGGGGQPVMACHWLGSQLVSCTKAGELNVWR